jgi:hypothetical protein
VFKRPRYLLLLSLFGRIVDVVSIGNEGKLGQGQNRTADIRIPNPRRMSDRRITQQNLSALLSLCQ